ncbi:MAG: ADP-forming succinate--CoA ligase subunit beta [Desulfobacterales bacterium]|nr:MAG: ADP-forming succinate--CoA ligase subunit beta [Desulfobacterales bacterium]
MKLYEFEGKILFEKMGIPTPQGHVVADVVEARDAAERIGYPVVVKSQVLRGGRGKAGGIAFAANPDELTRGIEEILGMQIGTDRVDKLLIEEQLEVAREIYLGITFDPHTAMPLMMVSAQGGMDIEAVAKDTPDEIFQKQLDPLQTWRLHHTLAMAQKIGLSQTAIVKVAEILLKLINGYFKYDAITAEINPLIVDAKGRVSAADAKMEIDDAALFRQPLIQNFERQASTENPLELEAQAAGVSYVRLSEEGNIGLIAGGAGVGMATMDTVYHYGGVPANFLDLGGVATPEKTAAALKIVLKTPGVQGVFLNAFGGINNCREMAEGVVRVIEEMNPPQTITVKMRGHSQEKGWALLAAREIPVVKYGTTEEGILLLLEEMEKRRKSSCPS